VSSVAAIVSISCDVVALHHRLQLLGDVAVLVLARLRGRRCRMGAPAEQVHEPVELLAGADRHLQGDRPGGEVLADVLVDALEVGVGPVHHRHEEDGGQVALLQHLPDPLRAHLHPVHRQSTSTAVGHADARPRLAQEVQVARACR
jgi:hypothetical protein